MTLHKKHSPILDASHAAREALSGLARGETFVIVLPIGRHSRAEAVRYIGCECHKTLGAGNYRVSSRYDPRVAVVTYLAVRIIRERYREG